MTRRNATNEQENAEDRAIGVLADLVRAMARADARTDFLEQRGRGLSQATTDDTE